MNYCNQQNIAAVLMHFRGCSGEANRLLRSYHSGDTGDLQEVISHLKKQGVTNVALLGYSLGGNVTLKYMGEAETDPSIQCAIAVSTPFLLDLCATAMDRGFARIYQANLVGRLVKKMKQKIALLDQDGRQFPDPAKMRNFWDFDDHFTAPIHGFDPFMTPDIIPGKDELSSSTCLELTDSGGHVGFVAGEGIKPRPWLESRIRRFLNDQGMVVAKNQIPS
jgi:hypothetical protein